MKSYRIIKKTYLDSSVYYRVQKRVFFFFWQSSELCESLHLDLLLINAARANYSHPYNLVGKNHSSYIDALEEVLFLEREDERTTVNKIEVV